ncbi:MAG: adenosine kinase [Bdellovibrionota bacterium]|jgi:sugar/nucleoside kinase (ribokinase family)|nr:adenosine kinase [Bdellovibrionota bacterium]
MKKHHVYGIGNALVDMEIEVSTEFLKENSVEKGLMTLVDQERQNELLSQVKGNIHKRSCGGSAANTIIGARQLGARTFYSCKVANDETGEFYFSNLVEHGVQTNLHGERKEGVTGKCMVFITPDADRTMNTFLGITETFSEEELDFEELKDSEYLYMEGYLVTSPTGKAAAIKAREFAKENGVKTALTFSDPGVVGFFKDGFGEMIGDGIDLLFCNEAEALSYSGKDNLSEALEELKKVSRQIAITQGPKGALLWDGEKEIDILTREVEAVDTNGAGDLFAGAFLYGLTHGHTFAESGKLACACSSELVTHFGPRLEAGVTTEIYKKLY